MAPAKITDNVYVPMSSETLFLVKIQSIGTNSWAIITEETVELKKPCKKNKCTAAAVQPYNNSHHRTFSILSYFLLTNATTT